MKALIKKYSINADDESQSEVMLEPWPKCVSQDLDDYLDNYRYALCENVPDSPIREGEEEDDIRTEPNAYEVVPYDYEYGDGEEKRTITRYKATFKGVIQ